METIHNLQKTHNKFFNIKNTLFYFGLFFIVISCAPKNSVTGHIEGLTNDTIQVMLLSLDNPDHEPIEDTLFAKNGGFEYTFPDNGAYISIFMFPQFFVLDRPSGGLYTPNNSGLIIFSDAGSRITLKGSVNTDGLHYVNMTGSKLNSDFSTIQNKLFEINRNETNEEMALEQAMIDKDKEAENAGWAKRGERTKAQRELFSSYIRENLDNPVSAYLLERQPLDSIGVYYDKLGENARNSVFSNALDAKMERYERYTSAMKAKEEVIVGSIAPDFSLKDMDGNTVTLSAHLNNGKYIILDFWGSWCGPCISGIPKMKNLYEKNREKIEIIGVACNERSLETWREEVKKYELPWINLYNDKTSGIDVKYGIEAYPTKLVLDPQGKIVMKEIGEGEDFYKKIEKLIRK